MYKNRIEVTGYLNDKPERRFLPSGTPVANARLGESYLYKSNGKEERRTNWHSLVWYGDLVPMTAHYQKGDHLFVVGSIEEREFVPRDGSKRMIWELIVQYSHVIAPLRAKKRTETGGNKTADKGAEKSEPDALPAA
jgi:single-strand DNA-binding protein